MFAVEKSHFLPLLYYFIPIAGTLSHPVKTLQHFGENYIMEFTFKRHVKIVTVSL